MSVENVVGKKILDFVDQIFLAFYCNQFSLISGIVFDYDYVYLII